MMVNGKEIVFRDDLPPNIVLIDGLQASKLWIFAREEDRCGPRKRPARSRIATKPFTLEKLLPLIREHVTKSRDTFFLKEEIALVMRAKVSLVEQCFHRLNLEGLLSQPKHDGLHDTRRSRMFPMPANGWAPDIYYRRSDDSARQAASESE